MSTASIPAPSRSTSTTPRHNYFWPILVFLLGAGSLAFYQVQSLEDQLEEVTKTVDGLDSKVKHAQYEKAKFFALSRDLARMAPKHPAAQQIVDETGIRNLQEKFPELMSLDIPSGFTNTAPAMPPVLQLSTTPGVTNSSLTNASPLVPVPDTK